MVDNQKPLSTQKDGDGARIPAPHHSDEESSNDEVPNEVIEIFEQIPQEERDRFLQRVRIEQSLDFWAGPFPPPRILKEFAEISPDFPERIMKTFESQVRHRQNLERLTVESDIERSRNGQWIGLIIMLTGLIAAMYVVHEGQSIIGFLIAFAFLAAQVGAFVYGRSSQKNERIRKQQVMAGEQPKALERDKEQHS